VAVAREPQSSTEMLHLFSTARPDAHRLTERATYPRVFDSRIENSSIEPWALCRSCGSSIWSCLGFTPLYTVSRKLETRWFLSKSPLLSRGIRQRELKLMEFFWIRINASQNRLWTCGPFPDQFFSMESDRKAALSWDGCVDTIYWTMHFIEGLVKGKIF